MRQWLITTMTKHWRVLLRQAYLSLTFWCFYIPAKQSIYSIRSKPQPSHDVTIDTRVVYIFSIFSIYTKLLLIHIWINTQTHRCTQTLTRSYRTTHAHTLAKINHTFADRFSSFLCMILLIGKPSHTIPTSILNIFNDYSDRSLKNISASDNWQIYCL